MLSVPGSLALEALIQKCHKLELLPNKCYFNQHLITPVLVRIKTCRAMLEFLQGQSLTLNQQISTNHLINLFSALGKLLKDLISEKLIFSIWNGRYIEKNISLLFEKISGAIFDLEVPNFILINKNISGIQERIDKTLGGLKTFLAKLESPSDLAKPNVSQAIAEILNCPVENIEKSYVHFIENFREKENKLESLSDETGLEDFVFTCKEAEFFWKKHFGVVEFAVWPQFTKSFEADYLRFSSQEKSKTALNLIREMIDPNLTGVIIKSSCNNFFLEGWPNKCHELISQPSPRILTTAQLTLKVISTLSTDLKIGTSYIIDEYGFTFTRCLRNDSLTLLGRSQSNIDLQIQDSTISSTHCIISFTQSKGFLLTDLGSSSGSFALIESPLLLKEGLMIQLASTHVILIRKCIVKANKSAESSIAVASENFTSDQQSFNDDSKSEIQIYSPDKSEVSRNHLRPQHIETIIELSAEQEETRIDKKLLKTSVNENSKENLKVSESISNLHSDVLGSSLKQSGFYLESRELDNEIKDISQLEIEFILKGVNKGRVFRFSNSTENISIGRDEDCTISISDPFISYLHGMINYTDEGWTYTDSFSSNKSWQGLNLYPSFLRKLPSPPLVLSNNQQLKLGCTDLEVSLI